MIEEGISAARPRPACVFGRGVGGLLGRLEGLSVVALSVGQDLLVVGLRVGVLVVGLRIGVLVVGWAGGRVVGSMH